MHFGIKVAYPIFDDTPDKKGRQDLKISSLLKILRF